MFDVFSVFFQMAGTRPKRSARIATSMKAGTGQSAFYQESPYTGSSCGEACFFASRTGTNHDDLIVVAHNTVDPPTVASRMWEYSPPVAHVWPSLGCFRPEVNVEEFKATR